ncbi:hypothetical protein B0A49_00760 [Cryomyces minteri]|uniref:BHLH domain-containing protein n=1 Tax=Cryomyces minteri TaxID=331657 RepID=A0A4U0XRH4_9PEZI|nr:hypothetical protein B0A49_00760 [Cryomyces minteri]
MPRATAFPPTPAPSTDIQGKEKAQISALEPAFTLPPAALTERERNARGSTSSSTASTNSSGSSYRPASPTSPATTAGGPSRKRSSAAVSKEDFTLPPPPTRSRKIIQMKPKGQGEQCQRIEQDIPAAHTPSKPAAIATTAEGKKKSGPGATAAGRKIARKTAHSLIERRRRSKMNEEFGVLKDMIPACEGQEMHKLAILQASIEYLRYLEQCVADLKANNQTPRASSTPLLRPQPSNQGAIQPSRDASAEMHGDDNDNSSNDEEMSDVEPTPATTTAPDPAQPAQQIQRNTSWTSFPQQQHPVPRNHSLTSLHRTSTTSSTPTASPLLNPSPYIRSTQTSPSFGPQTSQPYSSYTSQFSTFSLTSPALLPQPDSLRPEPEKEKYRIKGAEDAMAMDQEATAALLMLNTDRRSWGSGGGGGGSASGVRGMSVRDLLSG